MNIFYTEVDRNLQIELDARGRTGFSDRSSKAIDYMVGKIANVEIRAYSGSDSTTRIDGVLGGSQLRSGRYMPSTFTAAETLDKQVGGFLQDDIVTQERIDFYAEGDSGIPGNAYIRKNSFTDTSRRTGPYVESVKITIGDHSMGLLNKATVQFTIPNPTRDLDLVERLWFRPGRYASIDIEYPDSALVSMNDDLLTESGFRLTQGTTNGRLTEESVPDRDKLKNLYPSWADNIETYIKKMSRMNAVHFEGLITQFDFSYSSDGSISATLNITGTSNVYTDISMYLDSNKAKKEQAPKPVQPADLKVTGSRTEFYDVLYNRIEDIKAAAKQDNTTFEANQWILPFKISQGDNESATDRYVLFGEPYRNEVKQEEPADPEDEGWGTASTPGVPKPAQTTYSRYITFGALIHFVNNYILTKLDGSVKAPQIVFSDQACYGNYYKDLVSTDPDNILLLPARHGKAGDCNHYGELIYYDRARSLQDTTDPGWINFWPGVYKYEGNTGRYYPSRIFINILMINEIVDSMTQNNKTTMSVKSFVDILCSKISKATGYAFELKLVSHPQLTTQLMIMDAKYIDGGRVNETKKVVPYSIPMFSNHPNGSVVKDFSFSAKLPESAKNLSYVLNSGEDVSELDIAPYLNFMYNADNVDQLNDLFARHETKHKEVVNALYAARAKYGEAVGVPALQTALQKALAEYVKRPHPDFKTTTQMMAPIFPFEASVTLNGIHGFKYGDVLIFEALPLRYRLNTVFSIISIDHSVNGNGEWETTLKCIMRPNLD